MDLGYVMAPKRLVEEKRKVLYAVRDIPDNVCDSGWRFYHGDEKPDEIDDPERFMICDIETIIGIDPEVKKIISSRYKTAYRRYVECLPFFQTDYAEKRSKNDEFQRAQYLYRKLCGSVCRPYGAKIVLNLLYRKEPFVLHADAPDINNRYSYPLLWSTKQEQHTMPFVRRIGESSEYAISMADLPDEELSEIRDGEGIRLFSA